MLDRAREWKAISIYMALDEEINISQIQTSKKESRWLRWLGINTKPEVIEENYLPKPGLTLTTIQIKTKQLIEQSSRRVHLFAARRFQIGYPVVKNIGGI